MKQRYLTLALAAFGLLTFGCDSFLAIPVSPQLIESKSLLANEASVQAAVDGIYVYMRSSTPGLTNGAVSIYAGLSADELRPSSSVHPIYQPFFDHALLPQNTFGYAQLWTPGYQAIYRCNILLDALRSDKSLPIGIKKQFIGELLTTRALQYTYLAGLYGDVPLALTPDYETNAVLSRTPYRDVLQQVAADLREARELLPIQTGSGNKKRPGYWAATALLARVSLYLGGHTEAVAMATEVIDGPFALHQTLEGIFLIDGVETIWEITQTAPTGNTAEGGAFIPSSPTATPPVLMNQSVVDLFEPRDLRLAHWVGTLDRSTGTLYHPRKYTYRQSGEIHEYQVVLRLGEQYLIRAEANLALGQQSASRTDLNIIRRRANAASLDETVMGEALISALRGERQRELFAEWGHRWLDLRRWGIIDEVMAAVKPYWEPYMALFPIPEAELRYNYYLTQNEGY